MRTAMGEVRWPRWLPFIGLRTVELDAVEAWSLDEQLSGTFELFEVEWFGRGFTISYKRVGDRGTTTFGL